MDLHKKTQDIQESLVKSLLLCIKRNQLTCSDVQEKKDFFILSSLLL